MPRKMRDVDWMITQIVRKQFKDDMQTIVVMVQRQKKMPSQDMWTKLEKKDLWLIDGHHNI